MEGWDEVASYLAVRVRGEHVEGRCATWDELLGAAAARGVMVVESARLIGPGYYIPRPLPVILLRRGVSILVFAHELGHHIIEDNIEHDCDYDLPLVIFPYPSDPSSDTLENACDLFAHIVCGDAYERPVGRSEGSEEWVDL